MVMSGLASMYQTSDWSLAPGRHGYQRAHELISGKASTGYSGHQCSRAPGRPNLHLVLILSQTSAGNWLLQRLRYLKLARLEGAATGQDTPCDAR